MIPVPPIPAGFAAVQAEVPEENVVRNPSHYQIFPGVEAIEVVAAAMTEQQFYGYCLGNCLKYKLRAGAKDNVHQELGKAAFYQELYEQHRHLCKEKSNASD